MPVRTGIILILNSLVILVVLVLSFSFYDQFVRALDERVLLQLTSIRTLKRIQIEKYIEKAWTSFLDDPTVMSETPPFPIPETYTLKTGMADLTRFNPSGTLVIGFFQNQQGNVRQKFLNHEEIQEILLERTGMGNSGESYLVGSDFKLRSQSRFFPNTKPFELEAKTEGTLQGLANKNGVGIFEDYRGVLVYSAYHKLETDQLDWVILSEIDVQEAIEPLRQMQQKLITIASFIILVVILVSLLLTKVLTRPLIRMRAYLRAMSKGNYGQQILGTSHPKEAKEMYVALSELQDALTGAVDFSVDIGNMNLGKAYQPKSEDDLLGKSLENMRKKLIEYQRKEERSTLVTKRLLIENLEAERNYLSRELHDGIGPLLTSLKLYVQNRIDDPILQDNMKKMLDDTINEVRMMTYSLLPPSLEDFGLGLTLKNFISNLQKVTDIQIAFEDLTRPKNSRIPVNLQLNIFRICQELINNTIKHAQASLIRFSLSELDDYVSLYYSDNGIGFNTATKFHGYGLSNIKERVEIFHGTVVVQSQQGSTTFEIEIPLNYEED